MTQQEPLVLGQESSTDPASGRIFHQKKQRVCGFEKQPTSAGGAATESAVEILQCDTHYLSRTGRQ